MSVVQNALRLLKERKKSKEIFQFINRSIVQDLSEENLKLLVDFLTKGWFLIFFLLLVFNISFVCRICKKLDKLYCNRSIIITINLIL